MPSVHTVASGENLYRIALRYGITVDELRQANDINDVKNLRVGQTLKLPARLGTRTVQTEEVASATAPMVVSNPSVMRPYENGIAQRTLDSRSSATYGKGSLEWPLRGVLYGRYGRRGREMHDGVDLAAPLGTPIKTAAPGMVLFAGEQRGYGLIVVVEHEQGLVTLYAHNRDLRVRAGQKVRDGQVIATVGESGKTSGPHLHFEVRERGKAVDPLPRLGPAPRN